MDFDAGDLVSVRPLVTQPWRDGEVTTAGPASWTVELDTPLTSLEWVGTVSPLAPTKKLSSVVIMRNVEVLTPGQKIKAR
jgi:hypothetical protein